MYKEFEHVNPAANINLIPANWSKKKIPANLISDSTVADQDNISPHT